MELGSVFLEDITVGEHHRPIDGKTVKALAESMERVGLQSPILIYSPDNYTTDLVAGQHRVEAARKLGWQKIDCIFITSDAQLNTIDENLIRKELTPRQRDEERTRRVRRIEELCQLTPHNSPRVVGRPKSPVTQVAEEEGVDRETIRRSKERHEARERGEEPSNVVQIPRPDSRQRFIKLFQCMSSDDQWWAVDWIEEWAATGKEKRAR